jgi:hypothetical protein
MRNRQDPPLRRREAKVDRKTEADAERLALVQEAAEGHYHRLDHLLSGRDCEAGFNPDRSTGADPSPVLRQGLVELAGLMDGSNWDEAMKVVWRLYRHDSPIAYAANSES